MTLIQATLPENPIVGFAIAALIILGMWAFADFLLAKADDKDHQNIQRDIQSAYDKLRKDRP
jgi:hypothetical protein